MKTKEEMDIFDDLFESNVSSSSLEMEDQLTSLLLTTAAARSTMVSARGKSYVGTANVTPFYLIN